MDLTTLAEALGLPKDSPQDKVFARLLEERRTGAAAKESLSKLEVELGKYGLKLDAGSLVKLESVGVSSESLAAKDTDDAETKAWKTELAQRRKNEQLERIKSISAALSARVATGQLPPSAKATIERVLNAIPPKATVLALSSKGDEVVSSVAEGLQAELLKAIDGFPKMTLPSEGLSRLTSEPFIPPTEKPKTDGEALAKRGAEAAAARSKSSKTFKAKQAATK